jgi:hypothetical protein
MKQIAIKQIISGSNQIVSTKISKNVSLYFLLLLSISSILILPSCLVTTWGKSPERLSNDVVQYLIYRNSFAKQKQVETKIKQLTDKELSDNNYVDYVLLHQDYLTYTFKFFKTIQDKQSYLNKRERFINLVQSNINKIRIGMTYDELASFLKIRESDYEISKREGKIVSIKSGQGQSEVLSISYKEYEIEYYLYLKIENDILKEWHIIPLREQLTF